MQEKRNLQEKDKISAKTRHTSKERIRIGLDEISTLVSKGTLIIRDGLTTSEPRIYSGSYFFQR